MSDLISRQDAIDALQKEINKGIPPFDDVIGSIRCGVRLARNIIEDLPSTEPERKTGKWIDTGSGQECDQCHEIQYGYDTGRTYCANCGAKMEGEE